MTNSITKFFFAVFRGKMTYLYTEFFRNWSFVFPTSKKLLSQYSDQATLDQTVFTTAK